MVEATPQSTDARRAQPRIHVRLGAELRFADSIVEGATMNLSVGGVGIECDRELPEGESLLLLLFVVLEDIEDERTPPLAVKAQVMWSAPAEDDEEPCKAGLRFEQITPAQQEWLRRFLQATGVE